MKTRRWLAGVGAGSLLLIGGVAAGPAASLAQGDDAGDSERPISGAALERASAAALDYLGEGRVTDTEVGDEEGFYEVEVTLDNGNHVDVHLDEDFDILGTEEDGVIDEEDDENSGEASALANLAAVGQTAQDDEGVVDDDEGAEQALGTPLLTPDVTLEEAQEIALDESPDAVVAAVELEGEAGMLVYSVELSDGHEVEIDAGTGEVLEVEIAEDAFEEEDERGSSEASRSSVLAAVGATAQNDEDDDAGDSEQPITGVALRRASAAALDYLGEGRVTDTEVGDEEGYYEVEVTLDNGNQVDVHLDEDFDILGTEEDGATDEE